LSCVIRFLAKRFAQGITKWISTGQFRLDFIGVTVLLEAQKDSPVNNLKIKRRRYLVLGQNFLIFALQFAPLGVSVSPNPETAGVFDE
jgi:hypothetical protein